MSTINIGNNYGSKTINATNNNNNSELNSLIKEKESLQKDIQSLQKEAASSSGSESENLQTQVQSLQSQISNIDNQIAKIQAEKKEDISSENLLNDYNKIKYPSDKLDDPKTLNITLNKLDKNIKLLENEIILGKARGIDSENKDTILSNIKNNIKNINSKIEEVNGDESKIINNDIELTGNFVDREA